MSTIADKLARCFHSLRSARKAILGRGGEISTTAGLKDIADAVWNLPTDAALGYITDDIGTYEKITPARAMPYALIKSIGGATIDGADTTECAKVTALESRSAQILPFDSYKGVKYNNHGCTFTARDDGGVDVSGTPTGAASVYLYQGEPLCKDQAVTLSGATAGSNIKLTIIVQDSAGTQLTQVVAANGGEATVNMYDYPTAAKMFIALGRHANGTACVGTIYPMLNYGSEVLPFKKNTGPVDTLTIPEAVRALPAYGYGKSETVRNYIKWEGGKAYYVQMVDESCTALSKPVTTDISDLITTDNHIAVEGNGALVAVNADKLGVWSDIQYIINTGG